MDPKKAYTSLTYDIGSVASGPTACTPNPAAARPLSADEMQLATWVPIGASTRTLNVMRQGTAYVSLDRIGTTSVRRLDQVGPTYMIPLQACGAVTG